MNKEVVLGIRPEDMIRTAEKVETGLTLSMGVAESIVYTSVGDQSLTARIAGDETLMPKSEIHLQFILKKAHLFDKETEERFH